MSEALLAPLDRSFSFEHLPHDAIEWWAYHNAFDESSTVRDRLLQPFDRAVNVARLDSA